MKTKNNIKLPLILCLFFSSFFLVSKAIAQDTISPSKQWHYQIQPYVLFPNMAGTVALGYLPDAEIDVDTHDIFSHLKLAAMLYFEAHNEKWALYTDFVYMHLAQGVKPNNLVGSGEVHLEQMAWELAGLYRLNPWLEVGAGTRLNNITAELDLNTSILVADAPDKWNKEMSQTWLDPIVIARVQIPCKKWLFCLRGDIGGFGVGSNFAYQAQADAIYNLSKKLQTSIGYRMINMDYENGSGNERFLYDVTTFGPFMKFGFNF